MRFENFEFPKKVKKISISFSHYPLNSRREYFKKRFEVVLNQLSPFSKEKITHPHFPSSLEGL